MAKASGYVTPKFKYGQIVFDDVRGEVEIVGLTDAAIPWPIGKKRNAKSPVVYKDLTRAIRIESNATVCELWGITPQTVTKWRKALGVERMNAGTLRRYSEMITPERKAKMQASLEPTRRDPVRIEKIRQSKIGKPRPKSVIERVRQANIGRKWTVEQRRKHLERRKRQYPAAYRRWTAEEDQLILILTIREASIRTGRPRGRIRQRRRELGVKPYEQPAVTARQGNQ